MRRLGSMAAQMILAPGAHMIWQFGELGNYESTKKTDGSNNTDPKKVRWNYLTSAERKGLYDCYSELCWLRRGNADLFAQGATYESNVSASNWAQGRTIYASTSDKELICVINPNTTNLTVSGVKFKTTDNSNYRIASQSYKMSASFDASKGSVTVPANSYVVIVNNKISGIDDTEIDSKASCHVYGGEGRIVIEGEYENAEVYTVSGMKYNTLEVPAGFYIVTVDGQATKVLVK